MKLNIEELAREADLSTMTADAHCREDYWTATRAELEAFARLIVERCAQEAEKLQCHEVTIARHDNAWAWGTIDSADAIRNLMED